MAKKRFKKNTRHADKSGEREKRVTKVSNPLQKIGETGQYNGTLLALTMNFVFLLNFFTFLHGVILHLPHQLSQFSLTRRGKCKKGLS